MAHCVRNGVSYKRHNWDKDLVCKGCKLDAKRVETEVVAEPVVPPTVEAQ